MFRRTSTVGIIRFSVISDVRHPFKVGREDSIDVRAAFLFDDERMQRRFDLFETITLPSLRGQTDTDFKIMILASALIPAKWKERLNRIVAETPFATVDYLEPKGLVREQFGDVVRKRIGRTKSLVTFRLDDDDALAADYIERIKRYNLAAFDGHGISLTRGYVLEINTDMVMSETDHQNVSGGLAYISKTGKTIFDVSDLHARMHRKIPVITNGRHISFVMVTHGGNDTGVERRAEDGVAGFSAIEKKLRKDNVTVNVSELAFRWGFNRSNSSYPDISHTWETEKNAGHCRAGSSRIDLGAQSVSLNALSTNGTTP